MFKKVTYNIRFCDANSGGILHIIEDIPFVPTFQVGQIIKIEDYVAYGYESIWEIKDCTYSGSFRISDVQHGFETIFFRNEVCSYCVTLFVEEFKKEE